MKFHIFYNKNNTFSLVFFLFPNHVIEPLTIN